MTGSGARRVVAALLVALGVAGLAVARPDEEAAALQDTHLAAQAELMDQGHLIAAGPFTDQDDERLRGLSVLSVGPETTRRLYGADPAVRAGRLAVQVTTWMVPEGNVSFGTVRPPRSMAEAEEGP